MLKGKRYVLMDGTPGASGAGAGAAASGDAGGAAAGGAGAGAPQGGQDGAAGAGTPKPSSAMGAGAGAGDAGGAGSGAGAGDNSNPWAFIPEKFVVKNAAGEIDPQASARKVEEHRTNLEKRLGSGDIPPKTAAEYKLPELPEVLKDVKMDEAALGKFREDAHKLGLNQAQFEGMMNKYFELAPTLVNAGQQVSMDDTVKSLKEAWGDSYQANAQAAWRGMTQIAQIAGLSPDEVEAELGNSPAFNRIMAAVGQQLREDKSVNPGASGSGNGGMEEAARIQMSEEFRNPRHPGHAAATAKWKAITLKGVPNTPV